MADGDNWKKRRMRTAVESRKNTRREEYHDAQVKKQFPEKEIIDCQLLLRFWIRREQRIGIEFEKMVATGDLDIGKF